MLPYRLLPPMLVISGFYGTVSRFFVSGPRSGIYQDLMPAMCRVGMWNDALFINTYYGGVLEGSNTC